ncbi:MAG: hypothetical protein VKJ04_01000 [Vampirovibrionales bacterium]|nr:hypothetical protein [Vampirovibrionales bacterium]
MLKNKLEAHNVTLPMIEWQKLGCLFQASGQYPWMQSHTAVPIPLQIGESRFRIFFGTRNQYQSAQVGYVDIDIENPRSPLGISKQPVLTAGPPGYFDDNGVYPGSIIQGNDQLLYMYYSGRSNGTAPLYYMAIGLAVSEDAGKSFHKVRKSPILGRSEINPWMVSTPCVLRNGTLWQMWYLSGLGWEGEKSFYHIKYAESSDGIIWEPHDNVCIPLDADTTNVASPSVIWDNNRYRMWYSYIKRGQGYRIGYAESEDAVNWSRMDSQAGISLSPTGWDSTSMAYPSVFSYSGNKYMVYSGNGFGQGGVGLAIAK